jgi:hypothetical protein
MKKFVIGHFGPIPHLSERVHLDRCAYSSGGPLYIYVTFFTLSSISNHFSVIFFDIFSVINFTFSFFHVLFLLLFSPVFFPVKVTRSKQFARAKSMLFFLLPYSGMVMKCGNLKLG